MSKKHAKRPSIYSIYWQTEDVSERGIHIKVYASSCCTWIIVTVYTVWPSQARNWLAARCSVLCYTQFGFGNKKIWPYNSCHERLALPNTGACIKILLFILKILNDLAPQLSKSFTVVIQPLSTRLIKPTFLFWSPPPTQHHSFFRNYKSISSTVFSFSGANR